MDKICQALLANDLQVSDVFFMAANGLWKNVEIL